MDITGKLIQMLPLQTGEGKNGPWKKQDIIIETQAQYPKKVAISIWGDKMDESQLKIDNMIKVSFDVESREYNGKWYTDVKAWKLESAGAAGSSAPAYTSQSTPVASIPAVPVESFSATSGQEDDLPF